MSVACSTLPSVSEKTMSKALGVNPDIGLREMLQISQSNDYDVVYSPLMRGPGGQQGGTFIKPAPVHEGSSTTFDNPNDLPQNVSVSQLKNFQGQFNQAKGKGQTGLAILNHDENGTEIVSRRAALYAQYAGNGEVVAGEDAGLSLDEAQQQYVNMTGRQLASPNAY